MHLSVVGFIQINAPILFGYFFANSTALLADFNWEIVWVFDNKIRFWSYSADSPFYTKEKEILYLFIEESISSSFIINFNICPMWALESIMKQFIDKTIFRLKILISFNFKI